MRTLLRLLQVIGLTVVMSTTALAADPPDPAAKRPHPARAEFPLLDLGVAQLAGQEAVDRLGSRLEAVAEWYGKSADEFAALLVRDRALRLDRRGRLFVEEPLRVTLPSSAIESTSVQTGTLQPLDQTFLLHSRPGANRTIYLNFKGATLTGTAWNSGNPTINAQAFDFDGNPASFSNAELERIQYIWQRVAEDFAPFDVDVTTEAPPADRLTRSSQSDQVFGTTALITNSAGVYNCSCGGVAYIGAYDDVGDFNKPALVFYNSLGSGHEKYVAEAISHEVGHNIGLLHDGYPGGDYYGGHGSGATGWAPIMGVGYYQALAQWSKGEYSGANNVQNDLTVAESYGLPIRLDDHADTLGSATALASQSGSWQGSGVIERSTDVDVFSFPAGAGAVAIVVNPSARSPNLDVLVELRDASGALLATANPADALNASIAATLPVAGTYYVTVQGTGKGDPLGTGYTRYGSLGYYGVAVTAQTVTNQPPVAVASATPTSGVAPLAVNFSSAGSTDPDGSIVSVQWNFGDGSQAATGATASHTYAAGTWTAQMTVTDNGGLSASKSLTIEVSPVVVLPAMHVGSIAMSLQRQGTRGRAIARVKVVDANGQPVPAVSVSGAWSGLVTGSGTAVTNGKGIATFSSPVTTASGTFVFTVNGATLGGWTYDAAANAETSDSITR